MAKETKKQIKAQCINEARQQYAAKIKRLEEEIERLKGSNKQLRERLSHMGELEQRAVEAEEKNRSLMDWIERLQDFTNLSDADREEAIKTMREELAAKKNLTGLVNTMGHYYNLAFGSII